MPVRSLCSCFVVLQMGGVPIVEKADKIVVDNPVLGWQEVEVDELGGRPDEPLGEPQLSPQLPRVFNLGRKLASSVHCNVLASSLVCANTYDLTRRFCLKYCPRHKYAGCDADRTEKNLKNYSVNSTTSSSGTCSCHVATDNRRSTNLFFTQPNVMDCSHRNNTIRNEPNKN